LSGPGRPAGRQRDRTAVVARVFDRASAIYDLPFAQSIIYRPPQDEIVAELRRTGARRIADVGCGTGILTTRIQDELEPQSVYGCDASEGMLERARARSSEVTWFHCCSESLPLPDASLDAVVSSSAFHFFDQPAALAEFDRVLAPGGRLILVAVNPHTAAARRLAELGTSGTGRFPDAKEMRRLVLAAGFSSVYQHRVSRGLLRSWSPDLVTVAVAGD
jgi:ubiquinone/menaquinone biosynthesis C-methylase UbiE